jgi:hypothetical protein
MDQHVSNVLEAVVLVEPLGVYALGTGDDVDRIGPCVDRLLDCRVDQSRSDPSASARVVDHHLVNRPDETGMVKLRTQVQIQESDNQATLIGDKQHMRGITDQLAGHQ